MFPLASRVDGLLPKAGEHGRIRRLHPAGAEGATAPV